VTAFPAGSPDVREVLRVVRDALDHKVLPATSDRPQYVVRMACRLLDVIGAELDAGDDEPSRLAARLATIGANSEAELAAGLLDGRFHTNDQTVRSVIGDAVRWRVAIARPNSGVVDRSPG
jgi:hypothetical protein